MHIGVSIYIPIFHKLSPKSLAAIYDWVEREYTRIVED